MKALGKFSIVAAAVMLLGLWAAPAWADHGYGGGDGHGGYGHGSGGHHGHFDYYGHGGHGHHNHLHVPNYYGPSYFRGPGCYTPYYGGPSYYGGGNLGISLPRFGLRLNF